MNVIIARTDEHRSFRNKLKEKTQLKQQKMLITNKLMK